MARKYDTIVVGAGIAGVTTAYWLRQSGQKVLLVDKKGLLAGASGAAGAFLSPRLGKGGVLQKLTNEAYRFALDFYADIASEYFFQKGLIRLPKNEEDAIRFETFRPFIDLPFDTIDPTEFPYIAKEAKRWGGFHFPHAAFVDPMGVARKLVEGIETSWGWTATPRREGGLWHLGGVAAPILVLATGADAFALPLPYLSIGGVWGERVDVRSDADIAVTLHQKLSVSANIEGIVRIGATHVRNDPRSEIERVHQLIVDAVSLVPSLRDQQLVRIYAGHRASVSDHLPVVGALPAWRPNQEKLGVPPNLYSPTMSESRRWKGFISPMVSGGEVLSSHH